MGRLNVIVKDGISTEAATAAIMASGSGKLKVVAVHDRQMEVVHPDDMQRHEWTLLLQELQMFESVVLSPRND